MKTLTKLGLTLCLSSAFLFAAVNIYRGQLMDASCYNQNPSAPGKAWVRCVPTGATTDFAIHTDGRIRMLDPAGNTKALAALQAGDLKQDRNGDMPVVIDGHRHGNTIRVEGIRAHKSDITVH